MRSFLLICCLWVGIASAASAEDVRYFIFRVDPPGLSLYAPAPGGYTYLGRSYEPIRLRHEDFGQANQTEVALLAGAHSGNVTTLQDVPPFYGYGPRSIRVKMNWGATEEDYATPQGGTLKVIMVPDSSEAAYSVPPNPGLRNQLARLRYWIDGHKVQAGFVAFFALAALVAAPVTLIPYLIRERKLKADRLKFDELRKNVDINRDQLLGQTFDRWTIWKKLGAGGMAVVYWALPDGSAEDDDAVALKVMNDEVAGDAEYQKRFKREVAISNELNHPNIVRLIGWGEREGRLFLVMEFIKGKTLRDYLPEGGLSIPETVNIMRGLSAGLAHAHKLGVVHRDLKPDNVMINHNNQVKIMDLGLAKRDENKTAITKTGDTFGTPAYMAPEQIAGSTNPDPRTDQYAVGVMLFELLTGHRPFDEEDSLQMIMKHLQAEPPSIREFKPELPEAAAQVVSRMLAKDPSQRYPNMQAACAALEDALRPLLTPQP